MYMKSKGAPVASASPQDAASARQSLAFRCHAGANHTVLRLEELGNNPAHRMKHLAQQPQQLQQRDGDTYCIVHYTHVKASHRIFSSPSSPSAPARPKKMVLGLLGLLGVTAVPTTVGVTQGIRQNNQQEDEKTDERRSTECNLSVFCGAEDEAQSQIHGKHVVLRNDKVYIGDLNSTSSFPFKGFYLGYPSDAKHRGLVSLTSANPPAMGWIYADKDTMELKYGNRTASVEHIIGPWDWTPDEEGVTLEEKEAFVAVEEETGVWAVYFDRGEDGGGLPRGKRTLPISVERKPTNQESIALKK
ncbi:MAG: hypothetical protein M1831_001278 [Alyxoria varia]|nr:MAG: hypothetical protein M1831_001278 [Alyxoria varia]